LGFERIALFACARSIIYTASLGGRRCISTSKPGVRRVGIDHRGSASFLYLRVMLLSAWPTPQGNNPEKFSIRSTPSENQAASIILKQCSTALSFSYITIHFQ